MPSRASLTGLSPSTAGLSSPFRSRLRYNIGVLQPRGRVATPAVWALPRSLATTGGIIRLFSLPAGTKMFQFPAFASTIRWMTVLLTAGLSHSETRGSTAICAFPRIIAAYHVLRRLCEPRHPPFALSYFPFSLARHPPGIAHTFSCIVLPWLALRTATAAFLMNFSLPLQSCLCQYVKDLLARAALRGALATCGE